MAGKPLGRYYGLCVPLGRQPRAQTTGIASESSAEQGGMPSKWALQTVAARLLPQERITACHRVIGDGHRTVTIRRDSEKAWFKGIAACGSVWSCPVCARKIGEGRRAELQTAIDNAIGGGGGVALITLTFSHALYHRIDDLLPKMAEALRRLKSGRAWQSLKNKYGIIGSVRTLEVTHGVNGWHPHVHEIEFFSRHLGDTEREQLRADLFDLWHAACARVGLGLPDEEHGVDVRGASHAAQYVGKWGFASELCRPAAKRSFAGRNPWQLLADCAGGDVAAGHLFQEFFKAFKGRRQLVWSKGVRAQLGLGDETSDAEQAELELTRPDDVAVDLLEIDADSWAAVLKAEARGHILKLAMTCASAEEIHGYIAWLRDRVPITYGNVAATNANMRKLFDQWNWFEISQGDDF